MPKPNAVCIADYETIHVGESVFISPIGESGNWYQVRNSGILNVPIDADCLAKHFRDFDIFDYKPIEDKLHESSADELKLLVQIWDRLMQRGADSKDSVFAAIEAQSVLAKLKKGGT